MATPRSTRNPLFLGRWFDDEIVILCVRWYVSYKLSYRDLTEMMADRGLVISHTTVMRWVVRYAAEFEKKWRCYKKPVGGSWRVDELFVKVRTGWKYLYRAVDGAGPDSGLLLQPDTRRTGCQSLLPESRSGQWRSAFHHFGRP